MPTRVRALDSRASCEITFPRLAGYRYDMADAPLIVNFGPESKLTLSTADIPTRTENAPIVGESSIHNLDELKGRRPNEVAFMLAKLTLEKYFRQDGDKRADRPNEHKFDADVKTWLFPQLLEITRRWLAECIEVTGEKKKDKAAKVATARTLWTPVVNNHGGFGRWAFIEVNDPWNAQHCIREELPRIQTALEAV